ncbi:MAG: flavin reductase family protein [Chloracidobacterium sp.]|nr:flavin reductase family protein [Chloracidobacterium sp.]
MPISQDDFRNALSRFASGVTVVSTKDAAGKLHGITVSAFCSVSLDPPMVLICIEKSTVSHYAFEESGVFVVNILRDSQADASERFAAPFEDKFEDVEFYPGIEGIPVLKDALASLECRLTFSYHGGDHSIFVGQVENVTVRDGDPLVYFRGAYGTINRET